MNFDDLAFMQHPALLGAQPESPECERFDCAHEDAEEDEGEAMSALDAKLDTSTSEEMDASGYPPRAPSAKRCCRRNQALQRERNRAQREF